MGWRMPPITAMISTLIAAPTPMVPGEMRPLNQTSSTPATPGDHPGQQPGKDLVRGHVIADAPASGADCRGSPAASARR